MGEDGGGKKHEMVEFEQATTYRIHFDLFYILREEHTHYELLKGQLHWSLIPEMSLT